MTKFKKFSTSYNRLMQILSVLVISFLEVVSLVLNKKLEIFINLVLS